MTIIIHFVSGFVRCWSHVAIAELNEDLLHLDVIVGRNCYGGYETEHKSYHCSEINWVDIDGVRLDPCRL